MATKSYTESLKDPRWQRKRLEVMERAHFACEQCNSEITTLNVHHRYYEKGRKPWDYPDECFQCLCQPCHERVTDLMAKIQREIGALSSDDLYRLYGYVQALSRYEEEPDPELPYVGIPWAQGVADFHGDNSMEDIHVLRLLEREGRITTFGLMKMQIEARREFLSNIHKDTGNG